MKYCLLYNMACNTNLRIMRIHKLVYEGDTFYIVHVVSWFTLFDHRHHYTSNFLHDYEFEYSNQLRTRKVSCATLDCPPLTHIQQGTETQVCNNKETFNFLLWRNCLGKRYKTILSTCVQN